MVAADLRCPTREKRTQRACKGRRGQRIYGVIDRGAAELAPRGRRRTASPPAPCFSPAVPSSELRAPCWSALPAVHGPRLALSRDRHHGWRRTALVTSLRIP